MQSNFPPPAPLSIIVTMRKANTPPIPTVINVVFHNVASLSRNDTSSHDHTWGSFPYHPNHIQPAHPHLDSHHLTMYVMNGDDGTLSVVSSIIDMDDFLTIDTFPRNDDGSLYSLVSPPLVMRPFDVAGEEEEIEENRSEASMDITERREIFRSMEEVRRTYPLALLNGRGATNVHSANHQVYMAESRVLQPSYQAARTHTEKWRVERQLIDSMEQQGRVFIRRNDDGTFQLMSTAEKREKVQKRLYVRPSMRNVNVPLLPQAPVPPLAPQPPPVPQLPHVPQPIVLPPPPPNPQPLEPPVAPDVTTHRSEIMEDDDLVSTKTNMEDNDVLLLPSSSFYWGIEFLVNPPLVPQLHFLELPDVNSHSMDDDVSVLTYNMDMDFALDDPTLFPPNAISFPILPPLFLSEIPQVPQVLMMEDDDSVSTTV